MWQPIKTAPKDGTYVLLTVKYFEQGMVVACFDKETRAWIYGDDITGDDEKDCVFVVFPNGYWMPLPELPNG
jgi:hypothetical protein